jgi:uncharacterized HhH-GPD family protein
VSSPLRVTGDDGADDLLNDNPLALLIGMLLDQQIPIERAFAAPAQLRDRLGGRLDASTIAGRDVEDLVELFATRPALHRFPASMARRAHQLCRHLLEHHGGDAASVWNGVDDAEELRRRLLALPGFGKEKTAIFIALLAKRFGVTPSGWEREAGVFAEPGHHSVADLDGPAAVDALRQHRLALKAAGRDKKGHPR